MTPQQSFANAWQNGDTPSVRDFLPSAAQCHASNWDRKQVLQELVAIDMQYRWQSSSIPKYRVEDYLAVASEDATLGVTADDTVKLLGAEYLARRSTGDAAARDEIIQRFANLRPALDSQLDSVEDLIEHSTDAAEQSFSTITSLFDRGKDPIQIPAKRSSEKTDLPEPLGKYRFLKRLGSGTFADVYLAEDVTLRRRVAIKVPRQRGFANTDSYHAFIAEARAAAALRHPSVVTVYDVVQHDDGLAYVVMEYIDGPTLADVLRQGVLPAKSVIELGIQLAEGLAVAHRQGFVHRDLKPGNILVEREQTYLIADFGLAIHENTQQNQAGQIAGTPAYMSPEQVQGKSEWIDGRSDIWSVGVILYVALTGRLPFQGERRELFQQILERSPKPPRQIDPSIPRGLEAICLRCLAKNPTDRYASATELAEQLREQKRRGAGIRWEYVLVPMGISFCVIGTILALASSAQSFSTLWETTAEARSAAITWFLAIGLTLGIGAPLIVVGKWTCCRFQKSQADDGFSCRVSRKALYSLVAAVSCFGWGLPMMAVTYLLALWAAIELKGKRNWITGWGYVIASLIVAPVASIPSLLWWDMMRPAQEAAALFEQSEAAFVQGDYDEALAANTAILDLYPNRLFASSLPRDWATALRGRIYAAKGDVDAADQEFSSIFFSFAGPQNQHRQALLKYWRYQLEEARANDYSSELYLKEAIELERDIANDPRAKIDIPPISPDQLAPPAPAAAPAPPPPPPQPAA